MLIGRWRKKSYVLLVSIHMVSSWIESLASCGSQMKVGVRGGTDVLFYQKFIGHCNKSLCDQLRDGKKELKV